VPVVLVLSFAIAGLGCSSDSEHITAVRGSACGYSTIAGLFGGPQESRGCGQISGGPRSESPKVELPPPGSATPITATDADGAQAMYGPAAIFSGIWPDSAASAPPSGPISVGTQGTAAEGSVKSSVDITLRSPPNANAPGGIGPGPIQADEAHSGCTATKRGVTGSATFVKGRLTTSTDSSGYPASQEPIPDNPPPNYTRSVRINNVGGHPTIVFNEQMVNADGSLTVNAYHMYLFGPSAVGEQIVGQVTCGVTPSARSSKDTVAPTCGIPAVVLADPTMAGSPPKAPRTETTGVFDAGGLKAITEIQATNARVHLGNPGGANEDPSLPAYLRFVAGQKGPLAVTGIQVDPQGPTSFSFRATDMAGNSTRCEAVQSG
jgi:hypothetical protein